VTCGRWTCTTYLLVGDADQQVQTGRPAQVDRFSEQAADRDDHGKPLRRWKAHPLYCTGVMADHELTPPEPLEAREAMEWPSTASIARHTPQLAHWLLRPHWRVPAGEQQRKVLPELGDWSGSCQRPA
jgi:hypothetical protein